jgi:protein TilB
MKNLAQAPKIKDLYTTGNPCESWEGYKEYVIAKVPQLTFLNGNEILKSERIKANQNIEKLEKELEKESFNNVLKKECDPDKDNPNKYSKEYRRKLYKELEEDKLKKEEDKKKQNNSWNTEPPQEAPPVYKDNGEIRICNQGKYEFFLDEDIFSTGITTFELKLPKFLDVSQIKVDLNPQYVRVDVKGKITQLRFDREIIVEKSTIQRSTTTGHLLIKAPIVGIVPKEKLAEKKEEKVNSKVTVKKSLKPINENLDLKNNKIDVVQHIPSELIKNNEISQKIKEDIDPDIDLSEIPELD